MDDLEKSVVAELREVNAYMRSACPGGGHKTVSYTQETHNAFKSLFAMQQAQIAHLYKLLGETGEFKERLAEIEKRGVRYVGTWQKAVKYTRGDVVTDQGSMWACLKDSTAGTRPANAPDSWQLSAKGS